MVKFNEKLTEHHGDNMSDLGLQGQEAKEAVATVATKGFQHYVVSALRPAIDTVIGRMPRTWLADLTSRNDKTITENYLNDAISKLTTCIDHIVEIWTKVDKITSALTAIMPIGHDISALTILVGHSQPKIKECAILVWEVL